MNLRLYRHHVRQTVFLSLPIIASRAGAQLLSMLNLAMVGRAGTDQLSCFALATAPYFTVNLMAIMLFAGYPIEVARARAAQAREKIQEQWQAGVWSWIALSTLTLAGCLLVSGLRATGKTELETHRVLFVLGLGSPAFIGYFFVSGFLEAFGKPRPAALATAAGFAVNFVLNLVLLSRFPSGPGAAVVVAAGMTAVRWAMFLSIAASLLGELRRAGVPRRVAPPARSLRAILEQLRFGSPVALSASLRSAAFSVLTIVAAALGGSGVAAFSVASQLIGLSNMIANGIANATVVRVSRYSRLGRHRAVRASVAASLSLSLLFFAAISLFMVGCRETAFGTFTSDPAVLGLLLRSLGAILAAFAMDAVCTVLIGGLRPLGDRWIPQAGYGLILLALGVPLGYLAVHALDFGVTGMFASLIVSYLGAALFVVRRAWRNPYFSPA
jgi:MATE family multidrug resistance protein